MNKLKRAEKEKNQEVFYDKLCISIKITTAIINLSLFFNGLLLGVKIKPQPTCFPLGPIGIITPSPPPPPP